MIETTNVLNESKDELEQVEKPCSDPQKIGKGGRDCLRIAKRSRATK